MQSEKAHFAPVSPLGELDETYASLVCVVFTARRYAAYARAVYAVVECLSVCLSVTSQCSIETAKDRIT